MRYALIALVLAAATVTYVKPASAGCPPGTSYQCQQGMNGKVICGCR